MLGIPKTYKFKRCSFYELENLFKSKNADLYQYILYDEEDHYEHTEIRKGQRFIIYKNNQIIGYLGLIPFSKMIGDAEKRYKNYIKSRGKSKYNLEKETALYNKTEFYKYRNRFIKPTHNTLYITVLEIFPKFRSINTIKVVFNYIKQYCIENNFDLIICNAKDESVARLYQLAGFKSFNPYEYNPLMYLNINQKNYYEVTEKLKNKYKKNLFENMKDTKKLYEHIMSSVAKEVKKTLNENEYWDEPLRDDKEVDIQGDTEQWEDAVDDYLWSNTDNSADSDTVLSLFASLVYLNQLDDEEIKEVAKSVMEQIADDEDYDTPPVDEVFIESVAEKLKDDASDWCAEVIRNWKLNQ